jgi:hypothetical protein
MIGDSGPGLFGGGRSRGRVPTSVGPLRDCDAQMPYDILINQP